MKRNCLSAVCAVVDRAYRPVSLFVFLFLTGVSECQNTYPQKIVAVRGAVVEILVAGNRHGTGFCATPDGYIITATHVVGAPEATPAGASVNYASDLTVRFSDGTVSTASPVPNTSPEAAFHDITVLKVNAKTPHFLTVNTTGGIKDGEEVYIMGFPFDTPAAVTYRGTISAQFPMNVGTLQGRPIQSSTIHVQAPIAKGFSGAALIRMSDDTVIGVITNKLGGITPQLDTVRNLIRNSKSRGEVLVMGVNPNETSLELIDVLDNFLSAGVGWAVSMEHIKPQLAELRK